MGNEAPRKYVSRPAKPYLHFGDNYYVGSQTELENVSGEDVTDGYAFTDCMYLWDLQAEVSATTCSDFLYQHRLSQYSAADMDVLRQDADLNVFVIGASVASGTSATSKATSWHAIIESRLRTAFPDKKIYVFNAAMGAFISTQEKLAFVLSVMPRNPDVVLWVNGINDAWTPLSFGCRPGDPYTISTTYKYWYERKFTAGVEDPRQRQLLVNFAEKVAGDSQLRKTMLNSIKNVYTTNVRQVLQMCDACGAEAMVFLQPWRDQSRLLAGVTGDMDFSPSMVGLMLDVYALFRRELGNEERFFDLSVAPEFAQAEAIAHYTDACHFNDAGQVLLADAIFPHALRLAERRFRRKGGYEATTAGAAERYPVSGATVSLPL